MFSYRRKPSLTSIISGDTSFSSDNSYTPAIVTPPPAVLRQLVVRDLDEISSTGFYQQRPLEREPFRIPRPIVTIPRPLIYLPAQNPSWVSNGRPPVRVRQTSASSSPTFMTRRSDRQFYQNLPALIAVPPALPPPLPPFPPQYPMMMPSSFQRFAPIAVGRPSKKAKLPRIRPPGLFTTLSTGGLGSVAVLIYLACSFALPIAKLVLGVLYIKECPVNKNIPLYMIISGGCGLGIVVFLLLSSACNFSRSMLKREKPIHSWMICTIAFARGMQGALGVFLFIWFFFGNVWVFSVRYRVQTDNERDSTNYCHPSLYWFAFYVLLVTYMYVFVTCCAKFCINFFCCGACDIWRKAFS